MKVRLVLPGTYDFELPLGVLSLAAVAKGIADISLHHFISKDIIDKYTSSEALFKSFAYELVEDTPDILGFSTICSTYPITIRLAEFCKELSPETLIILGGPQASFTAYSTSKQFPFIDLIIRGEGEKILPNLLEKIDCGEDWHNIKGITYNSDNSRIISTPNEDLIQNLDELPLPAYDLLLDKIHCNDYFPVEVGRGCPFNCSFCSTSRFWGKPRFKSPEKIVHDISLLKEKYNIQKFRLICDTFTIDKAYINRFCHLISNELKGIEWRCSAHLNTVDSQLLETMAEAGCKSIFFGVESGAAGLQREISKNLNLEASYNNIIHAANLGMKVTASFIIGFPQEGKDEVKDSIRYATSLKYAHHNVVTQLHLLAPMVRTPLFDTYKDQLQFDGFYSDASDTLLMRLANREFLIKYPDIFPSQFFYPSQFNREASKLISFIIGNSNLLEYSLFYMLSNCGKDFANRFVEWSLIRKSDMLKLSSFTDEEAILSTFELLETLADFIGCNSSLFKEILRFEKIDLEMNLLRNHNVDEERLELFHYDILGIFDQIKLQNFSTIEKDIEPCPTYYLFKAKNSEYGILKVNEQLLKYYTCDFVNRIQPQPLTFDKNKGK